MNHQRRPAAEVSSSSSTIRNETWKTVNRREVQRHAFNTARNGKTRKGKGIAATVETDECITTETEEAGGSSCAAYLCLLQLLHTGVAKETRIPPTVSWSLIFAIIVLRYVLITDQALPRRRTVSRSCLLAAAAAVALPVVAAVAAEILPTLATVAHLFQREQLELRCLTLCWGPLIGVFGAIAAVAEASVAPACCYKNLCHGALHHKWALYTTLAPPLGIL